MTTRNAITRREVYVRETSLAAPGNGVVYTLGGAVQQPIGTSRSTVESVFVWRWRIIATGLPATGWLMQEAGGRVVGQLALQNRHLAHLESLTDSVEPIFKPIDSTHAGLPPVTAVIYRDLPEPGLLTGLTYGLSLADHAEWVGGKPELCITVRSQNVRWAIAVAFLAEQLRGDAALCYRDNRAINLSHPYRCSEPSFRRNRAGLIHAIRGVEI